MSSWWASAFLGIGVTAGCVADSTVSVTVGGPGSVTSDPPGLDCRSDGGTCSMTIASDLVVELVANTPATGAEFLGWSGACGGTERCLLDTFDDVAVGASFAAANRILTVATSGSGAYAVTSSPAGLSCGQARTCTLAVPKNTEVVLSAGYDPASTTFLGWTGEPACSTDDTCGVRLDQDRAIEAAYSVRLFLTLNVSGPGRVIGPNGLDCPGNKCRAEFPEGTSVTVHPEPSPGAVFTGWLGTCSGMTDCTVTIDFQTTLTAGFASM